MRPDFLLSRLLISLGEVFDRSLPMRDDVGLGLKLDLATSCNTISLSDSATACRNFILHRARQQLVELDREGQGLSSGSSSTEFQARRLRLRVLFVRPRVAADELTEPAQVLCNSRESEFISCAAWVAHRRPPSSVTRQELQHCCGLANSLSEFPNVIPSVGTCHINARPRRQRQSSCDPTARRSDRRASWPQPTRQSNV
jgi:hypothetical protein